MKTGLAKKGMMIGLEALMPDVILVCKSCGQKYKFTEQDQRDYVEDEATGDILDGHDPKQECKSCRIKQDGQRS